MYHLDVQRLCITGPNPHRMWHFEELALSLTAGSPWENRPCTLPRQHSGAGPGGRGMGEPAPRAVECGRADPTTCLPWSGTSAEVIAPLDS